MEKKERIEGSGCKSGALHCDPEKGMYTEQIVNTSDPFGPIGMGPTRCTTCKQVCD